MVIWTSRFLWGLQYFNDSSPKKAGLTLLLPKAICVLMVTLMEQPKLWRTAFGGEKKHSRSWQYVARVLRIRGATTCGWLPGCQIVGGWVVLAYCSLKFTGSFFFSFVFRPLLQSRILERIPCDVLCLSLFLKLYHSRPEGGGANYITGKVEHS